MTKPKPIEPTYCRYCGKLLVRQMGESPRNFPKRKYCHPENGKRISSCQHKMRYRQESEAHAQTIEPPTVSWYDLHPPMDVREETRLDIEQANINRQCREREREREWQKMHPLLSARIMRGALQ